ncbi:MAG TPA: hypothetical protein VFB96_14675 [Pirellulaceae bacterium]|nr:hypothetical protein [Pirellulaceae bacterium]
MAIPSQLRTPLMHSLWRRLVYVVIAMVVLVGGFLGWAYRATQQVPDFYVRQLRAEAGQRHKRSGDAFEQQALQLNNQIRKTDRWQARFTADEINAWLAADLPQKFPDALPPDVQSPRVAIESEMIQVACRVESRQFSSVVSLGVHPYVTSEPNVVALRVKQLRAGSLPLPLGQYLDRITEQCAQAGVPLRWSEEEGDPVALVTLPLDPKEFQNRLVRVEEIELTEGSLIVSGTSKPVEE